MTLVPRRPDREGHRSLEVTRTYLQRGQTASRSLWIRFSPKNPLLKAVMIPPAVVFALTMLILLLIVLGFTLLAVSLMGAISKGGDKDADQG